MTPELTREERLRMAAKSIGKTDKFDREPPIANQQEVRDEILKWMFHPIYGKQPTERELEAIDCAAEAVWKGYCSMVNYAFREGVRHETIMRRQSPY